MSSERLRYLPFCLAFIVPLFLYARWPSYQWNVDGVACAAALELGNPVYLFHVDHLIYGGLGFAVWKSLLMPLGVNTALPALEIMTFVMTAIGLPGLFLLLSARKDSSRWLALALTLAISVSAVVWVWSIEAQVYSLAFAALAWATYALLEGKSIKAMRAAGALHGLAILGHLMHGLWLVPAAYWIFQNRSFSRTENRHRFGSFFAASVLTASLGYLLVGALVLWPAHLTPTARMNWLKGSVGLTPDRHWAWHTQGRLAPFKWAYSSLCFFWGSFWPYLHAPLHVWIWALTILSMGIIGVLLMGSVTSSDSPRRNFALLWIGLYALLLWTWEPTTLCYRMTEGIPLAILLSLGLARFKARSIQSLLIGGILVCLLTITWTTRIAPMNRPENNTLYMQTLSLTQQTPAPSLYLTDGGVTWIYLLYFTHRIALNVYPILPATMEDTIATFKKSASPVFLDMKVWNDPAAPAWIKAHSWRPLDSLPWVELQ